MTMEPARGASVDGFVGRYMDEAPLGLFHYHVLALLAAGYFVDIVDGLTLGSLAPDILRAGFATPIEIASVASATLIGQFIGATGQGEISDRLGRKKIYQINLLFFSLATIAGAFAPTVGWLLVSRFFAGIGLGAELPMANAYAAEFSPRRVRGRYMATMQLLGGSIAWPLGTLFVLTCHTGLGWRGIWIAVGALGLFVWVLRFWMPESPRWLALHGKPHEALALLRRMGLTVVPAGLSDGPSASAASVRDPLVTVFRDYRTQVIAGMACFIAFIGVSYALAVWLPKIMTDRGMTITNSLTYTMLITLAFPAASLFLMISLERIGRRLSALGGFFFAAVFAVGFIRSQSDPMALVMGFAMIFALQVGGNAMVVFIAEVFPTNARATGFGLSQGAGRMGSAAIVPMFLWIQTRHGIDGVFAAIAVIMAIAVAGVLALGRDPRGIALDELIPSDRIENAA